MSEVRNEPARRKTERHAVDRLSTLLRVSEQLAELAGAQDEQKAYEIITEEASRQCRCLAVIRRYDPTSHELVLVVSAGEAGALPFLRIPANDGLSGQVYATRRAARIDDLHNPPPGSPTISVSDPATRSLMVNPIILHDLYYGSLGLSHHNAHYFNEDDSAFVDGLTRLLAATLHRFQYARLEADLLERQRNQEIISSVGDLALEFAHRIANDLGLVRSDLAHGRRALDQNDRITADLCFDHVIEAVQSVLDFSQMFREDARNWGLGEPTAFSATDMVDGVRSLHDPPSGCTVSIQLPADLPPVFANPAQIQSILETLAQNAFQAMPAGGQLSIAGRSDESNVKIEISDTGIGIGSTHRDHIFKFGFSTKGSSGYGLWSALQKARANGGNLTLASSEIGARFVLALPRWLARPGEQ